MNSNELKEMYLVSSSVYEYAGYYIALRPLIFNVALCVLAIVIVVMLSEFQIRQKEKPLWTLLRFLKIRISTLIVLGLVASGLTYLNLTPLVTYSYLDETTWAPKSVENPPIGRLSIQLKCWGFPFEYSASSENVDGEGNKSNSDSTGFRYHISMPKEYFDKQSFVQDMLVSGATIFVIAVLFECLARRREARRT